MNLSVSSPLSGSDAPIGVGLKSQHFANVLQEKPDLAFFEVHAENFMSEGGAHHRYLEEIAQQYPLSVHGVGMSLGSAAGLDKKHLQHFKDVVDRYKPVLISEHLSWAVEGGYYLNDLLPLPLNQESLDIVADNVKRMQDFVGQQLLVENPSAYMALVDTDIPEPEFLAQLASISGCGLLLDVNNVFVSGSNMGWDAGDYLAQIPADAVGEIHLAGHAVKNIEGTVFRVDDHGSAVSKDVWQYFESLFARIGAKPTLIEWDNDIPEFDVLMAEADKARNIMMPSEGVLRHG
ncbi:MAG: DUF692 domain-containing protein [Kordiimonas sp.]